MAMGPLGEAVRGAVGSGAEAAGEAARAKRGGGVF